jgi:hypothetical protein
MKSAGLLSDEKRRAGNDQAEAEQPGRFSSDEGKRAKLFIPKPRSVGRLRERMFVTFSLDGIPAMKNAVGGRLR